jgi:catechol 2,3-dioxygenase-like lactoylglutathione lyase family enzyme
VPRALGLATVLLVPDVDAALDYYRDVLGFAVEGHGEGYAFATRGEWAFHFAGCPFGPRPNSDVYPPDMFDVYLYVDDVDALHEELVGRGTDVLDGPVNRGYGMRDIRIRDLNGYVLGIGCPSGD